MKIRSPQDFLAGLLFLGLGASAVLVARAYPIGTAVRMGAGYFPTVLGYLLVLLGGIVAIRGLSLGGEPLGRWAVRPLLLVLCGIVAFAVLVRPMGLVLATLTLVIGSALGGRDARLREIALLALGLSLLAVGLFVYGLGLPFTVWPR